MANIKSQIKRVKISRREAERNKRIRSALKTFHKNFLNAYQSGNKKAAYEALQIAIKNYDKAVTKGVIHKNTAANKKSRLHQLYNSMK